MIVSNFVLCKQKTAYEMRISDWSSDVCSSDLRAREPHRAEGAVAEPTEQGKAGGVGQRRAGLLGRWVFLSADTVRIKLLRRRKRNRDGVWPRRALRSIGMGRPFSSLGARGAIIACTVIVAAAVLALHLAGRSAIRPCVTHDLWHGVIPSKQTSQTLHEWCSLGHVYHDR